MVNCLTDRLDWCHLWPVGITRVFLRRTDSLVNFPGHHFNAYRPTLKSYETALDLTLASRGLLRTVFLQTRHVPQWPALMGLINSTD